MTRGGGQEQMHTMGIPDVQWNKSRRENPPDKSIRSFIVLSPF